MSQDLVIAAVATALAVGTIIFLGVRLVRALVLYRLMRTVSAYPNVSMALALAARGSGEDMDRFRVWVARSVEENGWAKTDKVLEEMLRRLYPLGAMGAVVESEKAYLH